SPKSDETNKSVLTFQVTWTSKGAETAEATLEVTYSLSALDPVYEKLLEIDVLYNTAITLDGSAVTVTVEISLIEPENKLEYDVIANQDIVIPFTFKVLV
ncbi:hypothetical protein LJC17_04395, partial [Acholeplasma sp. OttesenSCG-928-E16]|nr:hypothetical protein [Acholeplasma sp. OttesenSCG-928-E16]